MTEPGPGFKPVEVDVYSMRSFALALQAEVETNLSDAVVNVNTQLKNPNVHPSGLYVEGRPLGADSRNEPVQHIANYHSGAMEQGTQLMIAFQRGMGILASLAMKVATEYRSTDDLNRATEEEIREKLNIPKDLPRRIGRRMMME